MTEAMGSWGAYELSRSLSLPLRDREIVIDRTCARCGCEYEWGVHVAFFAERAGLDQHQIASLASGTADDPCWDGEQDRLLIRAVDALHEDADIPGSLWQHWRPSSARRTCSTSSCSAAGITPSASWPAPPGYPWKPERRPSSRSGTDEPSVRQRGRSASSAWWPQSRCEAQNQPANQRLARPDAVQRVAVPAGAPLRRTVWRAPGTRPDMGILSSVTEAADPAVSRSDSAS
jgi:hypothetical protein